MRALQAPIPDDTRITVKYGSGTEDFLVAHPAVPQVVFCKAYPPGALSDASVPDAGTYEIDRIECELWTDGAADVTIHSSSYPELKRELAAKQDDCGLVLVEETLTLEPRD